MSLFANLGDGFPLFCFMLVEATFYYFLESIVSCNTGSDRKRSIFIDMYDGNSNWKQQKMVLVMNKCLQLLWFSDPIPC
jgi:hypothetical protein